MAKTQDEGTHRLSRLAASYPLLAADEERALARKARAGDRRALEQLITSHLRLLLSIASGFRRHGTDVDDLIGEGMVGLAMAAHNFDPERNVRFAAYAAFWIRAYIQRFTLAQRRIVRPPSTRNARRLLSNLGRVRARLAQTQAVVDDAAIARELGVEATEVEEISTVLGQRDVSLAPPPGGRAPELASPWPSPETLVAEQEERAYAETAVKHALRALSPRERQVIAARSLSAEPDMLTAIGKRIGLSRERVRQVHEAGLEKLGAELRRVAWRV